MYVCRVNEDNVIHVITNKQLGAKPKKKSGAEKRLVLTATLTHTPLHSTEELDRPKLVNNLRSMKNVFAYLRRVAVGYCIIRLQ